MNLSDFIAKLKDMERDLQKILYEEPFYEIIRDVSEKYGEKGIRKLNKILEILARSYTYISTARERLEKLKEGRK